MLSSAGQDNPGRYEYACVVPHKLFKFKSLSPAQNYLLLSMLLDWSFVLCFFPQTVFSFYMLIHRSGLVLHSHRTYSLYSVPALQHSSRTHSRYSGPTLENSLRTHPRDSGPALENSPHAHPCHPGRMLAAPIRMPYYSRSRPHLPTI